MQKCDPFAIRFRELSSRAFFFFGNNFNSSGDVSGVRSGLRGRVPCGSGWPCGSCDCRARQVVGSRSRNIVGVQLGININ